MQPSSQCGFGGLGTPSCLQIAIATPDPISACRGTTDRPPAGPRHFVCRADMTVHGIAALPIFLGMPAAAFAYARRFHRSGNPTWALYSAATGLSMLATMGLAGAGFNQAPRLVNFAGLL